MAGNKLGSREKPYPRPLAILLEEMEGIQGGHARTGFVTAVEVVDDGLVVSEKSGKRRTLKADTIVLAVGMVSNEDRLSEALRGEVKEVYHIGDCVSPGKVIDAVWKGFRTARLV